MKLLDSLIINEENCTRKGHSPSFDFYQSQRHTINVTHERMQDSMYEWDTPDGETVQLVGMSCGSSDTRKHDADPPLSQKDILKQRVEDQIKHLQTILAYRSGKQWSIIGLNESIQELEQQRLQLAGG